MDQWLLREKEDIECLVFPRKFCFQNDKFSTLSKVGRPINLKTNVFSALNLFNVACYVSLLLLDLMENYYSCQNNWEFILTLTVRSRFNSPKNKCFINSYGQWPKVLLRIEEGFRRHLNATFSMSTSFFLCGFLSL